MEIVKYALLVSGWLIFSLTHSIFATSAVKNYFRSHFPGLFTYYRLCYSVIATVIFVVVTWYNFSFPPDLIWQVSVAEKIIASFIAISGGAIMLPCMIKYFYEMSGIDIFFKKPAHVKLEAGGMNRFIRHPLYLGTILFTFGVLFWYPGWANLVSFFCITIYTLIGIRYEERKLRHIFGSDYVEYSKKVPMLIPRRASIKKWTRKP